MKKVFALILTLAMVLTLCACGGSKAPAGSGDGKYDTITLTMAVNGTDTQIDTKVANYFKQLVEEETQGSIIIEVYPNDQLAGGNATKGIEMIADGSTDLAAYATSVLSVLDERLSIGTVPWMFNNYTEARETIDATGLAYYDSILQQQGITAIGSFHNGFRQLSNGVSITSTSGVVEVQKYMTIWNYTYENDLFLANSKIWDTLNDATRQMLTEKAVEACNWGRDQVEAEQDTLIAEFEQKGMEVTILTPEQLAPFQEVVSDLRQSFFDKYGPEACAAFGVEVG